MKIILVTGDNYKTLISNGLTFGKKAVFICGKSSTKKISYSNFFFSRCDKDTEFVILDDCESSIIDDLFSIIATGRIIVEKRCEDQFNISPDIIINMNKENFYKCMRDSKYLELMKRIGKIEFFLI